MKNDIEMIRALHMTIVHSLGRTIDIPMSGDKQSANDN